jgi:hypothetical protein
MMRKTATKLTKVKINGCPFWCVTWPKIGKGRNRQFFKDKTEAATVLQQKLIEQENYGIAGVSFNEATALNIWNVPKRYSRSARRFATPSIFMFRI